MSVPTVDEDAWRTLEPGTAHPLQRLRAVRELVDAGINAGVLMAPIVPGFSSSRAKLERTIKAIADHGARFVGCNVMYLQDGTRDSLHEVHRARVSGDAAALREAVREEVSAGGLPQGGAGDGRVLQDRYGLREARDAAVDERAEQSADAHEPEQVGVRVVTPDIYATSSERRSPALAATRHVAAGSTTIRPSTRPDVEVRAVLPALADRQLDLLVDDALQEARAERQAVALRHEQLERLVVDVHRLAGLARASSFSLRR